MAKRNAGVRRHGNRWQAYVRVRGELITKTFPLDTPMSTILQWRIAQGARRVATGTFASDVATYLATVKHMPSYQSRKHQLEWWMARLGGHRSSHAVTAAEVDEHLSTLLVEGKKPGTVKHYRNALVQVFGKEPSEARRSRIPQTTRRAPRFIPPATIAQILDALPDRGRGEKGKERPDKSQTKARLWLLATTGIPQKQIGQLTAEHDRGDHLMIPGRGKGRGAAGRVMGITPAIRHSLDLMAAADAWGAFSTSSMRHSFKRALKALGLPLSWTPYDLRHTIGALVYADTGDRATVARVLGHADERTADIYAGYAHANLDRQAIERVGARFRK